MHLCICVVVWYVFFEIIHFIEYQLIKNKFHNFAKAARNIQKRLQVTLQPKRNLKSKLEQINGQMRDCSIIVNQYTT